MIEIRINKDVGSYESKLPGLPLTLRQLICVLCAAPFCIGCYMLLAPTTGVDFAGFIALVPGFAAWAFGWSKPYGMRMEKFLSSILVYKLLAPMRRKYICSGDSNLGPSLTESPQEPSVQPASRENHFEKKKSRYKVSPDALR